jgi:hypothetical protein
LVADAQMMRSGGRRSQVLRLKDENHFSNSLISVYNFPETLIGHATFARGCDNY